MSYQSRSQRWSHQAYWLHLAPSSRPSQYRDIIITKYFIIIRLKSILQRCVVMGDTVTWPAREAELLDIARDDGMDDPGSEPHMLLPEIVLSSQNHREKYIKNVQSFSVWWCHTRNLGIRLRKT